MPCTARGFRTNDDDNDDVLAINGQRTRLMDESEREDRDGNEGNQGAAGPDETNSKRDVLLITLTPGVRLNERRSQTREAPSANLIIGKEKGR